MENIKKLDWSWNTLLSPTEQFVKFNKPFTNNDILYCHLNDLDPNITIDQDERLNDNKNTLYANQNIIIDPRNNKIIDRDIINHTKPGDNYKPECTIYKQFPKKSTLTKNEHRICLRVLKFLNMEKSVPELDKKLFNETIEKRTEENKLFMDFVIEKIGSQPINEAETELNNSYKLYLIKEAETILARPNLLYILQTALPLPWSILVQNNQSILNNFQIVELEQNVCIPQYKIINFKKLKKNYNETILDNYFFSKYNQDKISLDNLRKQYNCDVIIPEETLIILLGGFEDIDCEWEFTLDIQITEDDEKFIILNKPLPLRSVNYVTNTFAFNQKLNNFVNTSSEFNWLEITNNGQQLINVDSEIMELNAVNLNMDYKIYKIDEKYDNELKYKFQSNNNTNIMVNCQLNNINNGNIINLLIVNSNLDFCDDKQNLSYINLSTKLQYKKQFGSEVMTKNELIKEWIRQTLIPNSITKRCHIDVITFDTILMENITIADIENDLRNLYNINILNVIASLEEFFKLIKSFPCCKYLLKYDPKHKNKIMIYKKEDNEKLIETTKLSTHKLYRNVLENCYSIQNKNILQISNTVVTSLHERYQIMPCCFPYWYGSENSISNDRNSIIEKDRDRKVNLAKRNKKRFKRKLTK